MNGGYQVAVLPRVIRQLKRVAASDFPRIQAALTALARTPRPVGSRKLTGRTGYRVRVGHYRVVYEIADRQKTVTILDIGLRKDIYR